MCKQNGLQEVIKICFELLFTKKKETLHGKNWTTSVEKTQFDRSHLYGQHSNVINIQLLEELAKTDHCLAGAIGYHEPCSK
jgi:hypothetical protein